MQKMREELGNVPELVGFQAMYCLVLLTKDPLKWSNILLVQHAETLKKKEENNN